jgi:hypothetical protein
MDFTYQNKINFLNYSNYDFMVGFSNSYTPAQGNVTMYIETYQAGKLLNRTALNTGECDTNTPGQVFTDADFNATLYCIYYDISFEPVTLSTSDTMMGYAN